MKRSKGYTHSADAVSQTSELYLLRYDLLVNGAHRPAGTPVCKDGNEWCHYLDGTKLPIGSDSHVCRSDYKGVSLSVVRCDDEGRFFAKRIGATDSAQQVDSGHVGFPVSLGAGCVCVAYGGRYFPLEFFGW